MRRAAAIGFALCCAMRLAGQFAPLPQAGSPEEFDAYLAVLDAREPRAVVASAEAFVRAWPSSGLRGHVYELEFEAYRALGDAGRAIQAAEESLAAAPDNLVVLANLAGVLANGTHDTQRLDRAEANARKVIALTKSFRVPRFIRPDEWDRTSRRLNSQAHAALGLVANQRGDVRAAIREFETAVDLAPAPDATQYYRLGMLYRAAGSLPAAREKLRRAAELHEPAIREMAERELRLLPQQ